MLNNLFHSLANEGAASINMRTCPVSLDDTITKIAALKKVIANKNSIEGQRNELIKELARLMGLDEDPRFADYLNG